MFTSLYTCPTCGQHAVEVADQSFSATTVTVGRCEQGPAWIVSTEAPKSAMLTWLPWGSTPRYQHRDGLVTFG